ncbi:MAG: mechanosensitive ion channel family protein [Hyphomicrobiaceae bacterium]
MGIVTNLPRSAAKQLFSMRAIDALIDTHETVIVEPKVPRAPLRGRAFNCLGRIFLARLMSRPRQISNHWQRNLFPTLALLFASFLSTYVEIGNAQEAPVAADSSAIDVAFLADHKMPAKEFAQRIIPLTRTELSELGKNWLKIAQSDVQKLTLLSIELARANETERQGIETQIKETVEHRQRLFRKFANLIEELEAKGAKPEEISEYRMYTKAVVRKEFEITDPKTVNEMVLQWIKSPEGGVEVGKTFMSLVLSLLAAVVAASAASALARYLISRARGISSLLRDFLSRFVYWLILFVSILLAISMNGINVTPLLAAFGGASFVIAFATQSTLSNLASGLLLMISRPFDVGDEVTVSGVSGKVKNVSIVSTVIRSEDGQTIIVPNTKVWDSVIVNRREIVAR